MKFGSVIDFNMEDSRNGIYKKVRKGDWKTHRIGSFLRITWGKYGYRWENLSQGGTGNGSHFGDFEGKNPEWKKVKTPEKYIDKQDLEPLNDELSDVLKKLDCTYENVFVAKACPHCGGLSFIRKDELEKL
jgi:hypothetical protein